MKMRLCSIYIHGHGSTKLAYVNNIYREEKRRLFFLATVNQHHRMPKLRHKAHVANMMRDSMKTLT